MGTKQIRPGDFVEVKLDSGFGYLRYITKYSAQGPDVFVVLDNKLNPAMFDELLALPVRYFVMTFRSFFSGDDRFRVIKGTKHSTAELPIFRQPYGNGWHLKEADGDRLVGKLSGEEKELPIYEASPANELVQRLQSGWQPQDETRNSTEQFLDAVRSAQKKGWSGFSGVTYFVDFPTETQAVHALGDIRQAGYKAELRRGELGLEITVRVGAENGATIDADWAQGIELSLASLVQPFEGSISGHEFD